ncbi:hypothetical protein NEFER02_2249 [Nematocida sp. LUAm2]|nr:hypothetical protein NEFER02_2249 [Nematocida sp. LUAm2]KAI5182260.1 hypothetical protein NEOKW01_2157 [Nematocida sp. AWRm80]
MSKGCQLSDVEKGQILAYFDTGLKKSEIARRLNRSRKVINNFLEKKENYGMSPRKGRPCSLSSRQKKAIAKYARGKSVTANGIKAHFDVKASKDTILRILKSDGGLKRRKYKRKPLLTDDHKAGRISFCKFNMDRGENWKNVIFSDEKKFNLDGPDGYEYYWAGIDSSPEFLSRKISDKKSVMIWGAFNFHGKSEIYFFDENINSTNYKRALRSNLIPFMRSQHEHELIFQQDNARPHVSTATLNWIEEHGIETLDWPAFSPDLNPIENLWGILVQRVYANGRCYDTVEELKESIEYEWANIEKWILESLSQSMKDRMFAVMLANGSNTKY